MLVFQEESDARRVLEVCEKRFGKYGLSLHPAKTRLVRFEPPGPQQGPGKAPGEPKSFDFLGFTHFWERVAAGRLDGQGAETASDQITRFLRQISRWCQDNRHAPTWPGNKDSFSASCVGTTGTTEITGNSKSLSSVHR